MSKQLKNLLTELIKATHMEPDKIPPGWFSMDDMIKETGLSYDTIKRRTRKAMEQGKIEKMYFRVSNGHNTKRVLFFKTKK